MIHTETCSLGMSSSSGSKMTVLRMESTKESATPIPKAMPTRCLVNSCASDMMK